jgi:hypothetical protein
MLTIHGHNYKTGSYFAFLFRILDSLQKKSLDTLTIRQHLIQMHPRNQPSLH